MQISIAAAFNRRGIYGAAPSFRDDFLLYRNRGLNEDINCFGYALGVKTDFHDHHEQTQEIYYTYNTMLAMPEIISYTGIEPIEDNNLIKIPDGCYPVAGFISSEGGDGSTYGDYHWYRMDDDGSWSHKEAWGSFYVPTKLDRSCQNIYNPLAANRNINPNYDKFIGFYSVPKGGAKLFSSRQESYASIKKHIERSLHYKPPCGVIQLTV